MMRGCELGLSASGQGPMAGSCQPGDGHMSSIESRKFIGRLSNYETLNNYIPWRQLLITIKM
jgi:hypothetical protein